MKPIDLKERNLVFNSDVFASDTKVIIEKIKEINSEDEEWFNNFKQLSPVLANCNKSSVIPPIKLYLNTYGGSVYDGLGLYDIIKKSDTPIEIECNGKIMSMGIILTLASPIRKAHKHTTFMIHSISKLSYGQLKDLEDDVDECKRLNDMLFSIIAENTSISKEKLQDIYEHKKNWFISAEDALSYGLITEII